MCFLFAFISLLWLKFLPSSNSGRGVAAENGVWSSLVHSVSAKSEVHAYVKGSVLSFSAVRSLLLMSLNEVTK